MFTSKIVILYKSAEAKQSLIMSRAGNLLNVKMSRFNSQNAQRICMAVNKQTSIPMSFHNAVSDLEAACRANAAKHTMPSTSESDNSVTENMQVNCQCLCLDTAETPELKAVSHYLLYTACKY